MSRLHPINSLQPTANGKIPHQHLWYQVTYKDNPQKDTLELLADFHFPNLTLEPARLEFGAIANDTRASLPCLLTNTSQVPAKYSWIFMDDSADEGFTGECVAVILNAFA